MSVSLYIHIPFCKSKCRYCDFLSAPCSEGERVRYIEALKAELTLYSDNNNIIDTVYIGGGTPSLISISELSGIIDSIYINFKKDIIEFSIECNPESVTIEKLAAYKSLGINRISLGVQSLNDKVLKLLGRAHDKVDAIKAMDNVGTLFNNWNIDFMLGLPGEEKDDAVKCVEAAINRGAKHISAYSLILEEGTPLKESADRGEVIVPDADTAADNYERVRACLEGSGYGRYEVSNFALPGYECIHNMGYWRLKEYIGAGLGAHGYLKNTRYQNADKMGEYLSLISDGVKPISSEHIVNLKESEEEFIMLALRTSEGIVINEYRRLFNSDFISKYFTALESIGKYLNITEKNVSIKSEFMGVMNSIIIEFFN
jgi:oxygen-independent coproporphyrinogen-3 oxidase